MNNQVKLSLNNRPVGTIFVNRPFVNSGQQIQTITPTIRQFLPSKPQNQLDVDTPVKKSFKIRNIDILCVQLGDKKYVARCQILALTGKSKYMASRYTPKDTTTHSAEALGVSSPNVDRRTIFISIESAFKLLIDNIEFINKGRKSTYVSNIVEIFNKSSHTIKITKYAATLPTIEVNIPEPIKKLSPIRLYIPVSRQLEIKRITKRDTLDSELCDVSDNSDISDNSDVSDISGESSSEDSNDDTSKSNTDSGDDDNIDLNQPLEYTNNVAESTKPNKKQKLDMVQKHTTAPKQDTTDRIIVTRKTSLKLAPKLAPRVAPNPAPKVSPMAPTEKTTPAIDEKTANRLQIFQKLVDKQEACIKLQREFYEAALERRNLLDSLMK
ncbi:hypothetical protein PRJ_Fausto_00241 [Faustovirus]|nr:hypothetical protein PRJ_Fausto_00241 [Faustovirus]QBR99149.1 hypothetical protein [Faustovirus mariensis]